jgi:hypothetical protein
MQRRVGGRGGGRVVITEGRKSVEKGEKDQNCTEASVEKGSVLAPLLRYEPPLLGIYLSWRFGNYESE